MNRRGVFCFFVRQVGGAILPLILAGCGKTMGLVNPAGTSDEATARLELLQKASNKSCSSNEQCQALGYQKMRCNGASSFRSYLLFSTEHAQISEVETLRDQHQATLAEIENCDAYLASEPVPICSVDSLCVDSSDTSIQIVLVEYQTGAGMAAAMEEVKKMLPYSSHQAFSTSSNKYNYFLKRGIRGVDFVPIIEHVPGVKAAEASEQLSTFESEK